MSLAKPLPTRAALALTIALTLALGPLAQPRPARADARTIVFTVGSASYSVNGQIFTMDAAPIIVPPGRVMVPVRYLATGMGMPAPDIQWNPDTSQVTLANGAVTETMTIGSDVLYVDGYPFAMDVAPIIVDGRTMLPARWVANNFGWQVAWRQDARQVIISADD